MKIINLLNDPTPIFRIQIDASGPWKVSILPFSKGNMNRFHSMEVPGTYEGVGEDVIFVKSTASTRPDTATFINKGDSNFIVTTIGQSGMDYVINEIGSGSWKVALSRDIQIIEVSLGSNGLSNWSVEVTTR